MVFLAKFVPTAVCQAEVAGSCREAASCPYRWFWINRPRRVVPRSPPSHQERYESDCPPLCVVKQLGRWMFHVKREDTAVGVARSPSVSLRMKTRSAWPTGGREVACLGHQPYRARQQTTFEDLPDGLAPAGLLERTVCRPGIPGADLDIPRMGTGTNGGQYMDPYLRPHGAVVRPATYPSGCQQRP